MSKVNKRGFTLVEIIITLAIVITITTVAIGSYIGISDKKKKEEWRLVKDQIETAAEQYFSSNKYLYEGLTDGVKAYISVGTLVKSDYLNKVVNPINKKEVPACSLVEVEIEKGKYVGKYDDNEDKINCNVSDSTTNSNKIIVKEKESTSGAIHYYKESGEELDNNGWFNIESLGEEKNVTACIDVRDSDSEKDAAGAVIDGKDINVKDDKGRGFCKVIENGTDKDIAFKLINSSGRTYQETEWVGVDTKRPVGSVEIVSAARTGYNSNVTNVRVQAWDKPNKVGDKTSKFGDIEVIQRGLSDDDPLGINESFNGIEDYDKIVNNYQIAPSLNGQTYTLVLNMTDIAGNEGTASDSYTVYREFDSKCVGGSYHISGGSSCSYDEKGNWVSGGRSDTSYSKLYDYYTGNYYGDERYDYEYCGCSSCSALSPTINCPEYKDVPKKTTTKARVTTKAVCTRFKEAKTIEDIKKLVSVKVSGDKLLSYDIENVQKDTSKNRVKFKFDGKSDGDKIKFNEDVAAVWTSDESPIEKTTWHNGWNSEKTKKGNVTKNTWCVTKYDCSTEDHSKFYVTACAYAKCGSATKKVCYSAYVTRNSKAVGKGFTYVGN